MAGFQLLMLALLACLLLPARALSDEAIDALRVGDCYRAMALEEADETGPALLAIARCQIRVGRFEHAEASLELVKEPELQTYTKALRWELWSALAAWDKLATEPYPTGLTGSALDRVQFLRGRALVEEGRAPEARTQLTKLLEGSLGRPGVLPVAGGVDPGEIRLWLGLASSGTAGERTVLETLWSLNPTSRFATNAEVRLRDLGHPPHQNEALVRTRIATLQKLQGYEEALALRDALGESDPKIMAEACFDARDYERALGYFEQIQLPTTRQRFDYALATSRAGDYSLAADRYRVLIALHASDKWADFASYKLGYLAFDEGDLKEAIVRFQQHLARYPSSEHNVEARWFIAWSHYRLGQRDEAYATMQELVAKHPKHERVWSARYWMARIEAQQSGSTAVYSKLIADAPASAYAYFAALRTNKTWPERPAPSFTASNLGAKFATGYALARVGLNDWGQSLLSAVPSPTSRTSALTLAGALITAGDLPRARDLARPYCSAPTGGDILACQVVYPRPAGEMLDRLMAGSGMPRHLPFALMNAESAMVPWVTSQAGARGLMQLMPEVAEKVHPTVAGETPFQADALYEPDYNAALGTTELLRLWGRYQALPEDIRIVATIAGYNGGQEAVDRWLEDAGENPKGDVFAENVGYVETRAYVRKVLGYQQMYRMVYGD